MRSTPSPGKKYSERQDNKKTDRYVSAGIQETGTKYLHAGIPGIEYKLTCLPIRESEKCQIMRRMSPECQRILNGTKWSENGFIPSFKATDIILEKVARRTYSKARGR